MFGVVIFFAIGLAYLKYSRKNPSFVTLLCSIFLIFYSYVFEEVWQIYLYGTLVSLIPCIFYFWRNR